MNALSIGSGTQLSRTAGLLIMLSALGEIGVGVALVPFPKIAALLLDMQLDAGGLLVARGLGVAALALGITWLMARRDPQRVAQCAAGFILYNLGVGALFAVAALAASRPALPWLVAAVDLVAGAGLAAELLLHPSQKTTRSR